MVVRVDQCADLAGGEDRATIDVVIGVEGVEHFVDISLDPWDFYMCTNMANQGDGAVVEGILALAQVGAGSTVPKNAVNVVVVRGILAWCGRPDPSDVIALNVCLQVGEFFF